jgi:hypothetical protein
MKRAAWSPDATGLACSSAHTHLPGAPMRGYQPHLPETASTRASPRPDSARVPASTDLGTPGAWSQTSTSRFDPCNRSRRLTIKICPSR